MYTKKVLSVFLLVFLTIVSCENESSQEKTYIIASKKINCQGIVQQKCFLIKENPEDEWQFLYEAIHKFIYEEGFEYTITVLEEDIKNPPQDASSVKYTLIKLISKIEKTSENLPN